MRNRLLGATKTAIGLAVAVALAIGASQVSGATSGDSGKPTLSGYAWTETIGWISFQDSSRPVQVNDDGTLTGYAWSENIGWVKFGGLSSFPNAASGANADLVGVNLRGWARACAGTQSGDCSSMTSRADGWDGWIALAGSTTGGRSYGVRLNDRSFSGYGWGSDVVGWMDWTGVFVDTDIGSCVDSEGVVILNGQSRTYRSGPDASGKCYSRTRTCTDGTLSAGTQTEVACAEPPIDDPVDTSCTRNGITVASGQTKTFYVRRLVRIGQPCDGEALTCVPGTGLVDSTGAVNSTHIYDTCRAVPNPIEF